MSVIQIRKAQREGARLVVGLAGLSGDGKTFTALQLAYGLAGGDGSKVGFLDAENKRGSLYADDDLLRSVQRSLGLAAMPEMFNIGDLEPPFSPQRYIDAVMEFQRFGVEVLVIDSATHEWEGSGGCEEIAEANAKRGMKDWGKAKAEHKRFMNAVLQSNMHIVMCFRAREKVEIVKEKNPETGRIETMVKPLGIMPVTEKNVMFEMTASLMMMDAGRQQQVMKCPDALRAALGRQGDYITAADGLALRRWVDGAKQLDPEVERARNMLRTTTEQGLAALQAAWKGLAPKLKAAIGPDGCPVDLKKAAQAYDDQRATAAASKTDAAVDDLNKQVLGGAESPAT